MNNELNFFKKVIVEDWYIQSGSAAPVFTNCTVRRLDILKKELGFGYTGFLIKCRDGQGEICYMTKDLRRMWLIIKNKLKKDPKYLEKIKIKYERDLNIFEKLFKKIDKVNLPDLKDQELVDLFKLCVWAQTYSLGLSHIIEPISIEIEKDFKKLLYNEIKEKDKFNYYFASLIDPAELSFFAQEEKELARIKKTKGSERTEKLKKHQAKYFWLQNNYTGPVESDIEFFRRKMKELSPKHKQEKRISAQELGLSRELRRIIDIINFTIVWQDQRKARILIGISYLGKVLEEIAQRTKLPMKILKYMGAGNIDEIKTLHDMVNMKKELLTQSRGAYFYLESDREKRIIGKDFKLLMDFKKNLDKKSSKALIQNEIRGMVANRGTAIGRVRILNKVADFGKMQEGEILVASMTRPEYMPAMKKAAAIITDEGGVTCHAAIVSRELGKPCVIGTKNATKVLKDGMLVEVKGNHGVIKLLDI